MRKSILFILLINCNIVGYNQVIKGTILDKQNHIKIASALVYLNGTFVRTNTDKNGKFELDISKFVSMPVTISASGYYSITISVVSPEKPVVIYLKPKEDKLNSLVSTSKVDDRKRKENLRLFKNTFLGTTWNARNCEIVNENEISFVSESNDTLKAFSLKPIQIDNSALGYKAAYFLDGFELNKKNDTFILSGNISFNEDLIADSSKKEIFEIRRKQVYIESRMCFFRSLWKNNLDSTEFVIKNSADEFLSYNQIVYQDDSLNKYLKCPEKKELNQNTDLSSFYLVFKEADVFYDKNGNLDPSSLTIITLDKATYFDKNGYFDPSFISWEGKMAKQRVGDFLPFEYSIRY